MKDHNGKGRGGGGLNQGMMEDRGGDGKRYGMEKKIT